MPQLDAHLVGGGDEIRRDVAAVELHALDHFELGLEDIVRRFEQATGKQAKLAACDQTFEAVAEERACVTSTVEEVAS